MADQGQQQPMPAMPSMMPMLIMMFLILILYAFDGSDHKIGQVLNYGLQFLDMNGEMPIVTLFVVGAIMAIPAKVEKNVASNRGMKISVGCSAPN